MDSLSLSWKDRLVRLLSYLFYRILLENVC